MLILTKNGIFRFFFAKFYYLNVIVLKLPGPGCVPRPEKRENWSILAIFSQF
jgi:hypothetical protein